MRRLFSFLRPRTRARDRESDGEAFSLPPPEPVAAAPPGAYDGAGERRILLDMRDRLWEDTAARMLREGSPPFATCVRRGEPELDRLCREEPPDVYFTEVADRSPYTAEERLARGGLRQGPRPGLQGGVLHRRERLSRAGADGAGAEAGGPHRPVRVFQHLAHLPLRRHGYAVRRRRMF